MKERLNKLLSVRSIVTLLLTICFVVMSLVKWIEPQLFITIYTTVIAFYFGTKVGEKNGKDSND